jgi:hypothetical protein
MSRGVTVGCVIADDRVFIARDAAEVKVFGVSAAVAGHVDR